MKQKLFFVDLLEYWVVEGLNFKDRPNPYNSSVFNTVDFERYVSGKMFHSFAENILSMLRNMNDSHLNSFLIASFEQSFTHIPDNRKDEIYNKYKDILFQNYPEESLSVSEKFQIDNAFRAYNKHYDKFKKFIITLFQDHQNGTLKLPPLIPW